ncbi:MAG: hypothetical protein Q7S46_01130 [Gallionella sp.]|nr:hypothetical protein [Gallionella sp.]
MTENPHSVFNLLDSSTDPFECEGLTYCWNGYAENKLGRSLLQYVDVHGERLRLKYLAWIHDLGETRINGKRLVEHLALDGSLSYWWMTLFVEKSPWKSPSIADSIRLMALEEIIIQQSTRKFRLVSANRSLHEAVSDLCHNLGIAYEWERLPRHALRPLHFRDVYRALPEPVRAMISLVRYLYISCPIKQREKPLWFSGDRSLFFCDYFENIDPKDADCGHFNSHFWGGLYTLAHRTGWLTNWLHLFIPSAMMPSLRAGVHRAQHFNQHRQEQGFHVILDAYLTWRIVLRVVKRWSRLALISRRLGKIKNAFRPQNSQLSLWPLMRGDWFASMRGSVAISNLLWLELFDTALQELPHQAKGLYLCENQAWERALIHFWRKHGHGQLIAVAHSTVRFWDLRYFADLRTARPALDAYPMPQADIIALNGKAAVDAYLSAGYPKEAIAECEALRYGYLNNLRAGHTFRKAKKGLCKVLILGDYMPSGMIKTLQLLRAAIPYMSSPATYTVKPHPNLPAMPEGFSALNLNVVTGTLGDLLHEYDIAYSSNLTSAAIDAYLFGLPVVVMLNDTELNFSPLRNQPNVCFVSSPEGLAEALQTAHQVTVNKPDSSDFFYLDSELPRWARLLKS